VFTLCITQCLSWVYPYIRYLSQRRSADTPKDASSAFFYLVKENLDDEWANPQKFADEVCLMV
jgi:hypothetical protein